MRDLRENAGKNGCHINTIVSGCVRFSPK